MLDHACACAALSCSGLQRRQALQHAGTVEQAAGEGEAHDEREVDGVEVPPEAVASELQRARVFF